MKNYQKLKKIKSEFQPYIKDPKWFYSFIAPQEEKELDLFFSMVEKNYPDHSIDQVLGDIVFVEEILEGNFDNTDLGIYIRTKKNPVFRPFMGSLDQYIKNYEIEFKINSADG